MAHKSRTDWCVLAAIALAIAAFLLHANYWMTGPVLLILVLCAYPQTYETTSRGLVVRDALTRRLIPYDQITWAGPGSSGGLMPGRLKLQYGLGSHLVLAPANPEELLSDLAARAPQLARNGDQLMLRDRHVEYCFRRAGGFRIGMGRE